MLSEAIKLDRDAIYTLVSAVELTGISRATLRRAIKGGELIATKRGASWFIAGSELQRWLAPNRK